MITRISIKNYRGIEATELAIPPAGAVVKGRNRAGKTSVLRAIRAALMAQDIGPDAIRKGAEKSEILVDLDHHSVRRAITQKGTSLTVTKEGMKATKPQTYLTELLGTSSLDPLDLLLLKGRDRRDRVLAAMPCEATVPFLHQYVPRLADDFDCSGHGLEVIERVRSAAYAKRTAANAAAKEAQTAAFEAAQAADVLAAKAQANAPDVDVAMLALESARSHLNHVSATNAAAQEHTQRTETSRLKVSELRNAAESERVSSSFVVRVVREDMQSRFEQATQEVTDLRKRLEEAERQAAELGKHLACLDEADEKAKRAQERAKTLDEQADSIEAAIASVPSVDEEAQARAEADLAAAQAALESALLAEKAREARAAADEAVALATSRADEAARLDKIVKGLTDDAPAALLAQSDGIQGLTLNGDEIFLDGVSLDGLCGEEQIRFAVKVARRANAKSKILVVDGLERLDPDAYKTFVREATRDGYQLLGTRVDAGELVIEAIVP